MATTSCWYCDGAVEEGAPQVALPLGPAHAACAAASAAAKAAAKAERLAKARAFDAAGPPRRPLRNKSRRGPHPQVRRAEEAARAYCTEFGRPAREVECKHLPGGRGAAILDGGEVVAQARSMRTLCFALPRGDDPLAESRRSGHGCQAA
jgi:hypothetical protein